jgi:hypothetical protein
LETDKRKSEDRAIDALMAAAFRIRISGDIISDKEAEKLVAHPPRLSDEDEAAIASLGPDLVKKLLEQSVVDTHKHLKGQESIEKKIEEAYIAMNRQLGDKDLSDETCREIERKRQELLGGKDPKGE